MSKSRNVNLDHDDFITSVGDRLGDNAPSLALVQSESHKNKLTFCDFSAKYGFILQKWK